MDIGGKYLPTNKEDTPFCSQLRKKTLHILEPQTQSWPEKLGSVIQ